MRWFAALASAATAILAFGQPPDDPVINCIRGLMTDERFSTIAGKISLGPTETTFAMLADDSRPTDSERAAIGAWAEARDNCVKGGLAWAERAYPAELLALGLQGEHALLALTVELVNKKITYGEYNKRRQAMVDEIRKHAAAVAERLQAQRVAEKQTDEANRDAERRAAEARAQADALNQQAIAAQNDIARRQMAMGLLLNQLRSFQPPAPMVPYQIPIRPVYQTVCSPIGNTVYCTTR